MKLITTLMVIASGALVCGAPTLAQTSQPRAPIASPLDEPGARFEFAEIPEHVFVRGRSELVQMGIWQIDPENRWAPGDQTRASGWTSNRITRLINVATGQPAVMFGYDGSTAQLAYAGAWAGDVTVRIETLDGAIASNPFRIRVLTPTVVYGDNAAAASTTHGWNAVVCEYPEVSFASCRKQFKGGASDAAPLVLFVTSGNYSGQDFFIGSRAYNYMIGEPSNWPKFNGDTIGPTKHVMYTLRNLDLNNTNINSGSDPVLGQTVNLSNIKQCCEPNTVDNGVVNANGTTKEPWIVNVWNFVSIGMGNAGNTNHAFYIEGRAKGKFQVNNSQCRGAKGSSCYKSDMAYYAVRNSLICTTQSCTSEGAGTVAAGMTTHSMIDTPAAGTIIVYNNHFKYWKNHTQTANLPTGYKGAFTPPVFIRQRKAFRGSDVPWYPDVTYDPPVSTNTIQRGIPGPGWDGSAATFVNPAFWNDVKNNPDAFAIYNHYISFNIVERLPNTVGNDLTVLRDDGTMAIEAVTQFGKGRVLRVPQNWRERSRNYLYSNTYIGLVGSSPPPYQLDQVEAVGEVEPGAIWPRTKPEHFPTATDLTELPPWFKL